MKMILGPRTPKILKEHGVESKGDDSIFEN